MGGRRHHQVAAAEEEEKTNNSLPLFETKEAKGKFVFRVFSLSIFIGICFIWAYRLLNLPTSGEKGRWLWIGMFFAELGFGFYWILTQSHRWNVVRYYPLKHNLSQSCYEKFPGVDIFVCTADPTVEPPTLVINTVLSALSLNYPTEKLSVYLSDDGGSQLTFYALLEASRFAKLWIPFCKKFNIEPRSPQAYFTQNLHEEGTANAQEWLFIKKQYEGMMKRIEDVTDKGSVPEEVKNEHKGLSEWNSNVTKQNHQPIVQIVIDGRDINAVDSDGCRLPTLVYMAREKRPDWPHHFKAGAENALIRVSSEISNGSIILNLDCDMYANNGDSIIEALCFFMDEKRGHQIAFVQHPQHYNNITKNDLYGNSSPVLNKVELHGVGGYGTSIYCGTGVFHRRMTLCGSKYSEENKGILWNSETRKDGNRTVHELEEASKALASCGIEKGTQWGEEMGLIYGCPVEDVVTGLRIQCNGWRSVYYKPENTAFVGVAPPTLDIALVQFTRWSDGLFQIFISKYCPFIYGHNKIALGAQMAYSLFLLWAPSSLPALYYAIVLPFSLFQGIPLFPEVSSRWFIPFAYVFISKNIYSIAEALSCGSTFKAWWNLQRIWLIRRTTSFFFAFIDCIVRQLGLSQTTFTITAKVVTEDVIKRYQQEIMDFGSTSIMFTVIATLSMVNLLSLVWVLKMFLWGLEYKDMEKLISQVVLCGLMVIVNAPVYEAMFFRKDKGSIPTSVMFKSLVLASSACLLMILLC